MRQVFCIISLFFSITALGDQVEFTVISKMFIEGCSVVSNRESCLGMGYRIMSEPSNDYEDFIQRSCAFGVNDNERVSCYEKMIDVSEVDRLLDIKQICAFEEDIVDKRDCYLGELINYRYTMVVKGCEGFLSTGAPQETMNQSLCEVKGVLKIESDEDFSDADIVWDICKIRQSRRTPEEDIDIQYRVGCFDLSIPFSKDEEFRDEAERCHLIDDLNQKDFCYGSVFEIFLPEE